VDATGTVVTVVAVVGIAAGEAEAEAEAEVVDAISRVLPKPFLTAENLSGRRALCLRCKPSRWARKRFVPPCGFHLIPRH
jgi:hypothetical protein